MLFVLFSLGDDRYALDARCILEVLPLVDIKRLPRSAPGIAGIINYHGDAIPVVDLSVLTLGRPARNRLSTRIVVAKYAGAAGATHALGLIAEGATETMHRSHDEFAQFGIANGSAPYLGPITPGARGFIQRIDVDRLLPESIRKLLFEAPAA